MAGVVYEDIIPPDGVNEAYCFRDGVTVEVEGLKHRGTAALSKEEVEASISGKVKRVFTYARVQSTSPQMWIDAGGDPAVLKDGRPTEKWLEAVRRAYREAWRNDRNALMVARMNPDPSVLFAAGDEVPVELPVNLFTLIGGARTGPPHVQAGGNAGSIAEFADGDWRLTLGIG